jgi:pyruvyltransferase
VIPRNYLGYIWGVGSIDGKNRSFPHAKIKAVRGHLTRKLLNLDESLPVGDPAILIPLFYGLKQYKKYKLGVVPHYVDAGLPILNNLRKDPDVKFINVRTPVNQFIEEVATCEYLVSSSLHGLIAPEAMGIKSGWLKLSNKVIGDGYKFRDYYSVYGIEDAQPLDFSAEDTADTIISKINSRNNYHDKIKNNLGELQRRLLASFPFGDAG